MPHMDNPDSEDRRLLLSGTVAALASLMLSEGALAAARKGGDSDYSKADRRRPLAKRLADIVIPPSDTQGAGQAGAGDFLLMAVDARVGSMEPGQFHRVAARLDQDAHGSFLGLPHQRQVALVSELDSRAYRADVAAGTAESDWPHIKSAILAGYYTSLVGASKELVYDPVPGTRENIELTPGFRMFSNQGFGGSL